ncbi:hypothetical protein A6R68_14728 [Neotoma lepida]|uniref:Uncharacterized protein n=1 Tax=Neotoma lepida TaxID=56216 RepID=A0A1A6HA17_NEOLE|nr:hypothetical protein A6R68_14728 [Neotoma lepida]
MLILPSILHQLGPDSLPRIRMEKYHLLLERMMMKFQILWRILRRCLTNNKANCTECKARKLERRQRVEERFRSEKRAGGKEEGRRAELLAHPIMGIRRPEAPRAPGRQQREGCGHRKAGLTGDLPK